MAQPRAYIEPMAACGNRDGNFDIRDVLPKNGNSDDNGKNGIIPRIKKLSTKRNTTLKAKKKRYNLEITPAEQLFGPGAHSSGFQSSKPTRNGNEYADKTNTIEAKNENKTRPVTRLDNYKDIQPISVDVEVRNIEGISVLSNQNEIPKPPRSGVVSSSPPASLLLQVAPSQQNIPSGKAFPDPIHDKRAGKEKSSMASPKNGEGIVYAKVEHHNGKGISKTILIAHLKKNLLKLYTHTYVLIHLIHLF